MGNSEVISSGVFVCSREPSSVGFSVVVSIDVDSLVVETSMGFSAVVGVVVFVEVKYSRIDRIKDGPLSNSCEKFPF